MGWLDRILGRGGDQSSNEPSHSPPPTELVFEPAGPMEIARCPGAEALIHLERLRSEGRSAGFTAVLLGTDDDVEMLQEGRDRREGDTTEWIRRATELDVDGWLAQRLAESAEAKEPSTGDGDWPAEPPAPGEISSHRDPLTQEPYPVVCLARLPTTHSWEVPILTGMGDWNECPDASVLAAFAHRWQLRYGAEIVSATHDVLEFTVSDPPTTREAALELAREQYLLCADIVDQGHGSIAHLAAALQNSNYWYFWWD